MKQVIARQGIPDRLRGIARLGIALVNAPFRALSGQRCSEESIATAWDRALPLGTPLFAPRRAAPA